MSNFSTPIPISTSSGGGGDGDASAVQTAVNVGTGVGLFKDKVGLDLRFKSLVAGENVALDTSNPDEVGVSFAMPEVLLESLLIPITSPGQSVFNLPTEALAGRFFITYNGVVLHGAGADYTIASPTVLAFSRPIASVDDELYIHKYSSFSVAGVYSNAEVDAAIATRQPLNSNLTAFAGLTGAADRLPYFTGAGALSLATLTASARALLAADSQVSQRTALGLGTAATANLTASTMDTTVGRVLKVGDLGLGSTGIAIPSSNYNLAVEPGVYSGPGATAVNGPDGLAIYGVLQVYRRAPTVLVQEATYGPSKFFRSSTDSGSNWLPWLRIAHSGNILGTVSQSAGVPTGAIIERGSNANGEYVRFADGTQICTRKTSVTNESIGINTPSSSLVKTWTYPAVFIAAIHPVGEASLGSGSTPIRHSARLRCDDGTSAANYTIYTDASMPTGTYIYKETLYAIGRWY